MAVELDRTGRRIVGVLIEKQYTTPDQYPLTLNALTLGCNQKSNRHPPMELPDFLVEGALKALFLKQWTTAQSREGGRTERYGHRTAERLSVSRAEQAVLAELFLRGPQTSAELRARCQRMSSDLANREQADRVLESMAGRGLIELMERVPGERERRWRDLVSDAGEDALAPPAAAAPSATAAAAAPAANPVPARAALEARLELLESRVAALEAEVRGLASGAGPAA